MTRGMTPVVSSNIHSIGYDAATKVMWVKFKSGGEYPHPDVREDEYRRFMASESKGKHYHEHFKGRAGPKKSDA